MIRKGIQFVPVLLVALLTGLAFAHVLERPAKMLYDAETYTVLQRTLYVAWGLPNVGGFLEPAAIPATLLLTLAVRKNRPAFWLSLIASIFLLLAFPVVFFVFVAPANTAFPGAASNNIPINWVELRASWETGQSIRIVLQLTSLALLVSSILRRTARSFPRLTFKIPFLVC